MESIIARLCEQVNSEITNCGYTIQDFALRCDVSYGEMRRIANGCVTDIKLSTMYKIFENSHICFSDIVESDELEYINKRLMLIFNGNRYNISLNKFK